MEWALNAMRQSENGFDSLPNLTDDMGIVKLRGLPFGCSKEEIVQFFDGKISFFIYLLSFLPRCVDIHIGDKLILQVACDKCNKFVSFTSNYNLNLQNVPSLPWNYISYKYLVACLWFTWI